MWWVCRERKLKSDLEAFGQRLKALTGSPDEADPDAFWVRKGGGGSKGCGRGEGEGCGRGLQVSKQYWRDAVACKEPSAAADPDGAEVPHPPPPAIHPPAPAAQGVLSSRPGPAGRRWPGTATRHPLRPPSGPQRRRAAPRSPDASPAHAPLSPLARQVLCSADPDMRPDLQDQCRQGRGLVPDK